MSKKFILSSLTAAMCINMFSIVSYGLEIKDKNLLAELLNAADKNHNGQVDYSEVKDLEYLRLNNKYISDISDLKHFYNLESLISHNHSITDLSPLASLSKLTYLDLGLDTLSANGISDISPLKNMYNLDYLDLANHSISDISALSGLTGLKNLILENNLIVEVSPLANLNELTLLNIQGNELEPDLDFLTDLDDLQRLYVDDTYINTQDELAFFASGIHLYLQPSTPRVFNEFSPSSNTDNNLGIAEWDNNELVMIENAPEPRLPYSNLDTIKNRSQAVNLVGDAVSDLTIAQKKDQQVINLVTDFAEEAIYQVANKSFNSSNIITDDFIADLGREAEQTATELEEVIKKNGIDLNRSLDHNVMLSTNEKAGTFTVDNSISEAKDIDNLRISTKDVNLEIV
ncbi:hypothetical protein AN643_01260 [Candidatus Epulonipiscioides saccharophilum]|nr:hypothetical protein AN643_01260 [Epulopiscium sp. SCG-B10WGA-EpuloB]